MAAMGYEADAARRQALMAKIEGALSRARALRDLDGQSNADNV
jgi:hypothetical protein